MPEAPFIIGMDVSKTRTGICEGRVGETPRFYSISGNDMSTEAAAMRVGRWLMARTKVDKPDAVFIEAAISPAAFMGEYDEKKGKVKMTSNPATTLALTEIAGVVKFVLGMRSVMFRPARVQTVRAAFIGHGNLKKEVAKPRVRRMCELLGWNPSNNDESDGGAVWWWGGMQIAPKFYQPITPMMIQRAAADLETSPTKTHGGY